MFSQCVLYVALFVFNSDKPDVLEHLMAALSALLQDQLTRRENALAQTGNKLQRLDKVLNMSKAGAISCVNFESDHSDVTTLEGHLVLMLRSLKSKRRGSKRRSRSERGGDVALYKGSKLLEQKKKEVRLQFILLSADFEHLLVQSNPTKNCS